MAQDNNTKENGGGVMSGLQKKLFFTMLAANLLLMYNFPILTE
jgi:hypothetical protein